jgi:hypothetical protein
MNCTGPRTEVGKLRSKFNATKHGIFSSVALIAGESRAEFDALLEGLREHYQPKEAVAEILVDKLATQLWRYRRFLIAEAAEIQKRIAFPGWNNKHQSSKVVTIICKEDGQEDTKLMETTADPEIRDRCLGLLRDLKSAIETAGFDITRDSSVLTKLYGKSTAQNVKKTLFARYPNPLAATYSQAEQQKNESASPEPFKRAFLEELEAEIRGLDRRKSIESEKGRLEALRQYVPDSCLPERLIRYEINLERNISRTLSQLEFLLEIQLSHRVPPAIK